MWTKFGINCFQTNLSNRFVKKKIEHKKLINNRKLMLLAFDKKFYKFFTIKCQSTFELTIWLILSHCSRKNCSQFFQSNCCMKFMQFGKYFIFMPFGNYAIWDVIVYSHTLCEIFLIVIEIDYNKNPQDEQTAWNLHFIENSFLITIVKHNLNRSKLFPRNLPIGYNRRIFSKSRYRLKWIRNKVYTSFSIS